MIPNMHVKCVDKSILSTHNEHAYKHVVNEPDITTAA